ncbi:MAG: signal transduction histidine kinase/FixJ family two-component response regulator [Psychromonas sp.]|jgi:signal transduction histidine kinase/FixJ family two-component response regulator/purine-cytosine permease-like protein|uniref:hybrid sensor histidine kinase/response regulator n=1 Tax=Psychromonas sp. TaxID=1884585 RepID=UPI0039E36A62
MIANQKIIKARRTYNKLVANEMMEDFALRFTARRARKWSLNRISVTALGTISFLVLEAIGGAITLNYGFENSAWAILAVTFIIFFTGLPISYYAAKYGVDIDLLSRGAGFGYIGSTIASLIYASFTFIFFALEASIMSMALQILFGLPLSIGYIVSALLVLPLVTHGITYISRFQVWTQPLWIALQLLPLFFVFAHADSQLDAWIQFTGNAGASGGSFNLILFGAASAVLLSLVAQIGEQVDFLRFLPEKPQRGAWRWWLALIAGGPGWIIFGALKLFLGSFLAYFALQQGITSELASDPAHMYQLAYSYVFANPQVSMIVACSFVVISQLKINVANAYAGSLAWSNFFSRVTLNHPGRVVWMLFNVAIALLLMELGIYQTIASMLSVYSVLVLAWLSSVVADLVINKPLGISPKHIEFKRSHLYDINPVGVGSMLLASLAGFSAHLGWYGETVKALASFIACFLPFVTVPLIGWLSKGKYYLVESDKPPIPNMTKCHICENTFDPEDMTFCPAYGKAICSLCCSLDVRCGDQCRPNATLSQQAHGFFSRFLSTQLLKKLATPLSQFLALTCALSLICAGILFLIYLQVPLEEPSVKQVFTNTLVTIFFLLLIIIGVVSWLFILARSGNQTALKELRSQTNALAKEINAHEQTSSALQVAKEVAEAANEAKSRYLAGLSHELRTPLNVLLGYAQLLSRDPALPLKQREMITIVKRNGQHLADLIEGLLEISKIEAGRVNLQRDEFNLKAILQQLVDMFQMQASKKGLKFYYISSPNLPDYVATDKQRLRQILINLISNAIKYTEQGSVTFKVTYRSEVAHFSVIDTGTGISKSNQELIFKPFEQIRNEHTQAITGTGLGLTISRSLAELMGGEISLSSSIGQGSTFNFRLMLFKLHKDPKEPEFNKLQATGYSGKKQTLLVVDDSLNQRTLMSALLKPIGFEVLLAENAQQGFTLLEERDVDLLLLDVRMPVMNGWEMVKRLRESHYAMPVLMVSANARDTEYNLQAEGYHSGYIAKPVNLDALLGKIAQLLNLQWRYKESEKQPVAAINRIKKPAVPRDQYQALIALAEIGYLSGFKDKFTEIESQYCYPPASASQIREYVEVCNFPKIIEYLRELNHEA